MNSEVSISWEGLGVLLSSSVVIASAFAFYVSIKFEALRADFTARLVQLKMELLAELDKRYVRRDA